MRDIHHHASAEIICFDSQTRFLVSVYDESYPNPRERGKANLLGGNFHEGYRSPQILLLERFMKKPQPHPVRKRLARQ